MNLPTCTPSSARRQKRKVPEFRYHIGNDQERRENVQNQRTNTNLIYFFIT